MNKKLLLGSIIVIGLIITLFLGTLFSVISEEDFTCDIVKDSCEGWSDCTIRNFNGKQIACINGENIIPEFDNQIKETTSNIGVMEVVKNEGTN